MNLNNYTIKSQEAIQQALQLAASNGHQAIETGHILKAILEVDENVTPFILKKLNINQVTFTKLIDSVIKSYPKVTGGQPYLSNAANQALTKSNSFLADYKDEYVSIEHLLLGLLGSGDNTANLIKDSGTNWKSYILDYNKKETE
jgi:ATP-dependent Clp protease ATP-binding subunit ClpB